MAKPRLMQKLTLLRIQNNPELTEVDLELENSIYCENKSFLKRQKLQIKGLNDGICLKKDVLTQLHSSSGNAETHQLSKFQVILIPSPGFGLTWLVSNPTPPCIPQPRLLHHTPDFFVFSNQILHTRLHNDITRYRFT